MKRACFKEFLAVIVLSLFLIQFSLGLQISEVMPDCGNVTANCEFIEMYASDVQNLSGYVFDTGGQKLKLNGSFQGYFVITKHKSAFLDRFGNLGGSILEWKGMGLVNGGDTITLIYQNQTVDSFSYSSSKKNSSWQLLKEWKECSPTPLQENRCPEAPSQNVPEVKPELASPKNESKAKEEEEEAENSSASSPQLLQEKIQQNTTSNLGKKDTLEKFDDAGDNPGSISEETITPEVIHLGGKNINIYKSRNAYISEYAIYGFAIFCILFIILLMIRRD